MKKYSARDMELVFFIPGLRERLWPSRSVHFLKGLGYRNREGIAP